MTPTPTLTPLTTCWPTRSRVRLGGRQTRACRASRVRQAGAARFNASIARAAVGLRPAPPASAGGDDLADHLRRPVEAQMRGGAFGRLLLGHGGVEIADLVGHAHEFLDLARRHAAIPPRASSCVVVEAQTPCRRGRRRSGRRRSLAPFRAPARSARRATPARPRRRSPPSTTISNEQRLVMRKNPFAALDAARASSAPIALSSALCRPTSSRDQHDPPVARAPGGAVNGAGQRVERLPALQFGERRPDRRRRDRRSRRDGDRGRRGFGRNPRRRRGRSRCARPSRACAPDAPAAFRRSARRRSASPRRASSISTPRMSSARSTTPR